MSLEASDLVSPIPTHSAGAGCAAKEVKLNAEAIFCCDPGDVGRRDDGG